ncbi:MAG: LD-carboxypeptidase [Bacteroidia bacterium]|nr:LD-carboxypeptidase [Bacteroidia bacterium]
MIHPPFLKSGDKIALVSVAGKVGREPVEQAVSLLREENFVVEITPHTFGQLNMFSGTDEERASDMQNALDDPEVKAILFARGGYGSLRTLMLLDWSGFFRHPKWLIGFSDITVFHSFLTCQEVASIHGVMPAFFFERGVRTDSLEKLLNLLRGKPLSYRIPGDRLNRKGITKGILIGGNLSLLISLRGTELDLSYDGKILFIEDIAEYDYHIDRMMMNLKFGGGLSQLAGLIVGYFTDTKTNNTPFGMSAYEIIQDAVSEYGFPVAYGFPAGHELPNFPLVMGSEISLEVTEESVLFDQSF